jgi:hypothetical protein
MGFTFLDRGLKPKNIVINEFAWNIGWFTGLEKFISYFLDFPLFLKQVLHVDSLAFVHHVSPSNFLIERDGGFVFEKCWKCVWSALENLVCEVCSGSHSVQFWSHGVKLCRVCFGVLTTSSHSDPCSLFRVFSVLASVCNLFERMTCIRLQALW